MKKLLIKFILFIFIFAVPQALLAIWMQRTDSQLEPRKYIFSKNQPRGYHYALLGDSEFCSVNVDSESQTLWKQIEKMSGKRVFPGALEGGEQEALTKGAIYLSRILPPGSTVFIDAIPGKNWLNDSQNYKNRFAALVGNYDQTHHGMLSNLYLDIIIKVYPFHISGEDIKSLIPFARPKREPIINRTWYSNDDYAKKSFEHFDAKKIQYSDFSKIGIITEIFKSQQIRPVFVLTPPNTSLVRAYSSQNSDSIIQILNRYHENLKTFLLSHNIDHIDLGGMVPSEGFADLIHTNAIGDEIIAKGIADYIQK